MTQNDQNNQETYKQGNKYILLLLLTPFSLQAIEARNTRPAKIEAFIKAMRLNAINENPKTYNNKKYNEIETILETKVNGQGDSQRLGLSPVETYLYLNFSPQGLASNYEEPFTPSERRRQNKKAL